MQAIVYRFFDSDGQLLYLGMTAVGPVRWAQHMIDQPWWPTVTSITIRHCDSVAEAAFIERTAIGVEQPRYNVIHKSLSRPSFHDPRRPAGSGSVYRKPDGAWIAQVSKGSRGQRRYVRRRRHTRVAAERALLELLRGP